MDKELRYTPIIKRQQRVDYCMKNHTDPDDLDGSISTCNCCGGLGVAAICPGCNGAGKLMRFASLREAQLAHEPLLEKCLVCQGNGQLTITRELFDKLGRKVPVSFRWSDGELRVM